MKKIFILGDSYSTFQGHIPEGYAAYYPSLDVDEAEKTWWQLVLKKADLQLVRNCSYSGTTVCHTGYSGDCSHISFLARLERLASEGFFEKNKIDELWIFGGTNDSWANSPIGEIKYGEISREEKFSALPGFSALLSLARSLPVGRVITVLNTELRDEITEGYIAIAEHFGIPMLRLASITKESGHPTAKGMAEIAEQFLAFREAL